MEENLFYSMLLKSKVYEKISLLCENKAKNFYLHVKHEYDHRHE